MRWTIRSVGVPRELPRTQVKFGSWIGKRRFTDGFLWLPKIINGQLRWLEWACWLEECRLKINTANGPLFNWVPLCWHPRPAIYEEK